MLVMLAVDYGACLIREDIITGKATRTREKCAQTPGVMDTFRSVPLDQVQDATKNQIQPPWMTETTVYTLDIPKQSIGFPSHPQMMPKIFVTGLSCVVDPPSPHPGKDAKKPQEMTNATSDAPKCAFSIYS